MWLLLSNLLFANDAGPEEAQAHITVQGGKYEEIYMEDPRVICSTPCSYEQDTSNVFVEANRHHKSWFRSGKITGVYNDETIRFNYPDCEFKKDPFKCANENGIWVMKVTFTQDAERASVNVMLFDENATMIGQGTYAKFKRTRVIQRKKVTQQQVPGSPGSISKCNKADGSCATIPFQGNGQTISQSEDLVPVIIDIPPTITDRDIGQAIIMMYDSVRP